MKFDFLIPASPTPAFFSQIAMFRLALDHLGSFYRDARLVAVFGDRKVSTLPDEWLPHFARIEVAWTDPAESDPLGYFANGNRRFDLMRPEADLVFMCDADTIPLRPFSKQVLAIGERNCIGGVIAHYHFPWTQSLGDSCTDWNVLSKAALGTTISTNYRYSLTDDPKGVCPFYVNYGFLAGSPTALRSVDRSAARIRPIVREFVRNNFQEQIILALAAIASEVETTSLPMRNNFPNDPIAEAKFPDEMANIQLLHYLRLTHFDRQKIFVNAQGFSDFLALDLSGSNRIFQDFVRAITASQFPFGN